MSEQTAGRGLSERALASVRAFIQVHMGQHITLECLAEAACMSRFHFARMFRISTGDSPMNYLRRARVERARALLEDGMNLSQIAIATGFCDQSHFTRSFRRMTGMTPRRYVLEVATSVTEPVRSWRPVGGAPGAQINF
jgi:AraC family transcriptional regulator